MMKVGKRLAVGEVTICSDGRLNRLLMSRRLIRFPDVCSLVVGNLLPVFYTIGFTILKSKEVLDQKLPLVR